MAATSFNLHPGRVVEAEIFRRYGSPVNFVPSLSSKEFIMVLSVGRCKLHLSASLVKSLLQSVLGGSAAAFRVIQLDDRVFCFSVANQQVGFHIHRLRAFECQVFKIFFHLWHNGGPNFRAEYKSWCREQAAEWIEVSHRKSVRLTGANAIPLLASRSSLPASSSKSMEFSNFQKTLKCAVNSVFKRGAIHAIKRGAIHGIKKTASFLEAGILGPIPDPQRVHKSHGPLLTLCSICLSPAHSWPGCKNLRRCRICLLAGHDSGQCRLVPRPAPFPSIRRDASTSYVHRPSISLIGGPPLSHDPKIYRSVIEYIREFSSIHSPPSPIVIP